jgi:hypothetical protein
VPPEWHPGPPELEELDRWYLEQHPEVRERMWAAGARAAEEIGMTAPTGPRRVVDGEPAVLSCDIAPPSTPPSKVTLESQACSEEGIPLTTPHPCISPCKKMGSGWKGPFT